MLKNKIYLLAFLLPFISCNTNAQVIPETITNQGFEEISHEANLVQKGSVSSSFSYTKGQSMEAVFRSWAKNAGYSFYWKFPSDFPDIVFEDDYELPESIKEAPSAYLHVLKALKLDKKITIHVFNGNNTIVVSPKGKSL